MELFDTHTHLESSRFEADRDDVIARAISAGVTRLVTCGSDLPTSEAEIALMQRHVGIYAAVGIHGHRAATVISAASGEIDEHCLTHLRELAAQAGVVAIGEIGLDYHYDFSPRDVQQRVMARQLALAAELDLPVIIHDREADDDTRRLIEQAPPVRGVLHCFLADARMAEWAVDRGFYLGVAGPITFGSVVHLADIVRRAPRDRLLVETDCPYLSPHPKRGRRNEPAFVRHVAEKLSEILDLPLDELAHLSTANACRLFRVN